MTNGGKFIQTCEIIDTTLRRCVYRMMMALMMVAIMMVMMCDHDAHAGDDAKKG